jgi:hypothetical protein
MVGPKVQRDRVPVTALPKYDELLIEKSEMEQSNRTTVPTEMTEAARKKVQGRMANSEAREAGRYATKAAEDLKAKVLVSANRDFRLGF